MNAGIYIHVPYCVKKCDYCDFYSVSQTSTQKQYFSSVRQEMMSYLGKQIPVDSVFIGGGTPSVAYPEELYHVLETVREVFAVSDDCEITIELNPKTFDRKKLECYREAGVNRISMGLQSANPAELVKLGRIHTVQEFLTSYELLCEVGFSNINTDIMYGLPDSDRHTLEHTLNVLRTLSCEHISAYALTLEEHNVLFRRGYRFPTDDEVFEQYQMVCDAFSDYRHYEISNFAKKESRPCRHNLKYWNREPYLGFGAAAHSFYDGWRWANPSDISDYIVQTEEQRLPKEREQILASEEEAEKLMLYLRTDRGIYHSDFKEQFFQQNEPLFQRYLESGLMQRTVNGYRLTEEGFFVSNTIISSFCL